MVKGYLLDTSIVIDKLRVDPKQSSFDFFSKKGKLFVSGITLTELWAGESMNLPENKLVVEQILQKVSVLAVEEKILKKAGELLRKNKNLALADALVAATVLIHKITLVTHNTRHFLAIEGISLTPTS